MSPELQQVIDQKNRETAGVRRKQFARKATTEQRLATLLASCATVLDAYYDSVNDPSYGRKVSLAIRELRSTVVDVRGSYRTAPAAGSPVGQRLA